ncbi:uncharacterized protein N7469_006632 [Penicillium citrinum]|uniref:F-box domain-containing protein n=1 Tax=Penicillium citrinum TaxID=5077 RepID=A0A9W9TKY4_PENCI|nr:uncharacterized protein N7469_006632 [Penicillium citrinum]KAJ5226626.1 hypothetical protein N7469_006632 [Penicillium citrinum]KAK5790929.1 hypothetical protein VI817_006238 [Penicillium citrinum]
MSIVWLPSELLMLIAHQLDHRDLNALLQAHSSFHQALNDYLYYCNVQYDNSSALFWAATHGSLKTVQHLLDAGANVRWNSDYWKMSRPWGKRAPYLRIPAFELREHPISYAATNGHMDIVQQLLQEGADINFKDRDGRGLLALAARNGHFALVKMLISRNVCQLLCNRHGQRSISDAASQGHNEIADFLLSEFSRLPFFSRHPKFTIQAEMQWMLYYAAQCGDQSRIKDLVASGADVNFRFKFATSTPLYAAVASAPSPVNVVKLLLELGADPNIGQAPSSRRRLCGSIPRYLLPLDYAIKRSESYPLIKLLLEFGANARDASQALYTAVNDEKPAEFRLLVEHGADIYIHGRKKSLFKLALECPCDEIRNVILEHGITPDTPDPADPMSGRSSFRIRY